MEELWIAVIVAIVAFAVGVGVGGNASDQAIAKACALQGTFVVSDTVYDCTPRAKR